LFGGGHPVTAVGDPCQSIYGWRGASAGNMRRFADVFPPLTSTPPPEEARRDDEASRAAVRLLSTSFRNTGKVLDVAAAIQRELREIAPEVPRLIAPPERARRGSVVAALLETSAAEAAWVAEQVAGLLRLPPGLAPDGEPWPEGRTDAVRPSDIAVLCRKRTQFAALRSALEADGIPVEVVGLGGLLTVPEVSDIVATLRVLHSPAASDSLVRTLTSPRWRIGPQDLVALGTRARALAKDQAGGPTGVRGGSPAPVSETAGSETTGSETTGSATDGTGQASTSEAGRPVRADDHLTRAVADFTAEAGSLVEALDDLGNQAGYSAEGYPRLQALAAELRTLRRHAGRPLPELVTEVERALGLDVEVAARPGSNQAAARADLDAFADAAAAFAGDAQEPTLGAFLAYLTAAETEEFGLEAGQVSDTDAVKLATVHSAKGLQWAAVVVPGLAAGTRAQNFPARPRLTTRWTENPRLLPFWLRGDEIDLPALSGLDPDSLAAFSRACAERNTAEERRLAYVAVTRAAYWLACTGYWWGAGKSPLGPSPFLEEVAASCRSGAGEVAVWADQPAEDAVNPALAEPLTASWPRPPGGTRYEVLREAGDLVLAEEAGPPQTGPPQEESPETGPRETGPPEEIPERFAEMVAGWDADADLLLAERSRRRPDGPIPVELPRRFGVSALVTMARDPAQLAAQIRRPMPRPPAPRAERGTAFHRWLEERFGQMRLIDVDDLAGAVDADMVADDADLTDLKARFESGEWRSRWPAEVEMPFETRVGDLRRCPRRRVRRRGLEDRPAAASGPRRARRRRPARGLPAGLGGTGWRAC